MCEADTQTEQEDILCVSVQVLKLGWLENVKITSLKIATTGDTSKPKEEHGRNDSQKRGKKREPRRTRRRIPRKRRNNGLKSLSFRANGRCHSVRMKSWFSKGGVFP